MTPPSGRKTAGLWRIVRGVVVLIRAHACATAAAGVVVGGFLADATLAADKVLLMATVVFLLTAGGNALNDFVDRDIDRINRAIRPIPSGALAPNHALFLALGLFALGVGASLALSPWCVALALVNSAVLIFYARSSKRLHVIKNVIVGYLVGSVFLFAAYTPDRLNSMVVALACCAGLATFAREIVKDVEDLDGDRHHGARTLPIILDARRAYLISFSALALAVLVSLIPYAMGLMNDLFLVLNMCGAAVFVVARYAASPRDAQRLIMAGSTIELTAFVAGRY